jgi:hypothetical protein
MAVTGNDGSFKPHRNKSLDPPPACSKRLISPGAVTRRTQSRLDGFTEGSF